MRLIMTLTILAGWLIAGAGFAQTTLYKVTDPYGNVTYQDRPPEDDVGYEAKRLGDDDASAPDPVATEPDDDTDRIAAASASRPLVLFTVSNCDACDVVRWFLEERSLPFEEVNVDGNTENQMRLREATGEYRVPVLMVGEQPLFGYDGERFTAELRAAGYLEEPAETEAVETGQTSEPPIIAGQGSDGVAE